ncbi:BA75_02892T0 [Komagataella pastoris]|uniref:Inheritance of peroxisomes protein 1 n=1 Tax=Komagataella pastoris TaxID=4922 RepID=A0A1B2JAB4_PICPA|nr:BA75_02892T0 [Komagataella pastoris]
MSVNLEEARSSLKPPRSKESKAESIQARTKTGTLIQHFNSVDPTELESHSLSGQNMSSPIVDESPRKKTLSRNSTSTKKTDKKDRSLFSRIKEVTRSNSKTNLKKEASKSNIFSSKGKTKNNNETPSKVVTPEQNKDSNEEDKNSNANKELLFEYPRCQMLLHEGNIDRRTPSNASARTGKTVGQGKFKIYKMLKDAPYMKCGHVVYPLLPKLRIIRIAMNQFIFPIHNPERYRQLVINSDDAEVLDKLEVTFSQLCQYSTLYFPVPAYSEKSDDDNDATEMINDNEEDLNLNVPDDIKDFNIIKLTSSTPKKLERDLSISSDMACLSEQKDHIEKNQTKKIQEPKVTKLNQEYSNSTLSSLEEELNMFEGQQAPALVNIGVSQQTAETATYVSAASTLKKDSSLENSFTDPTQQTDQLDESSRIQEHDSTTMDESVDTTTGLESTVLSFDSLNGEKFSSTLRDYLSSQRSASTIVSTGDSSNGGTLRQYGSTLSLDKTYVYDLLRGNRTKEILDLQFSSHPSIIGKIWH